MTTSDENGRFGLASPLAALVLAVLVLALLTVTLPVALANHIFALDDVPNLVLIVATTAVGVIVAWHLPANPMGWLILGLGVSLMLSVEGTAWLTLDYRIHHGRLPLGWLALLLQPWWGPAFVLFGLIVLLFPDGRLPSRYGPGETNPSPPPDPPADPPARVWRWLLWCYLAIAAVWLAGAWEISVAAIAGHHIQVDPGGELASLDNPAGATAWWGTIQDLFIWLLAVSLLASVGRQVAAYTRSGGERRQQVKWALAGTIVSVTCGVVGFTLSGNSSAVVSAVGSVLVAGVIALPAGIGVAILKYRLYDIDRIISRTLAYAIVTGLLAGVYAGLVLLATQVLTVKSPIAVAGSTLVAAALFSPLRTRVQRLVDRRFNRARYDAERTVAAFAARLQDAVDLDGIRADLVSVVYRSLEPAQVSVWLPPDGAAARGTPHGSRARRASS